MYPSLVARLLAAAALGWLLAAPLPAAADACAVAHVGPGDPVVSSAGGATCLPSPTPTPAPPP
ncbi:hypothetical protein EF905_34245, partial [Streptomyces sp. WAC05374]